MDLVRLVSSGTEACMSALRVARAFTKRAGVIKFEGCYHGHADPFLVKAGSGAATFGWYVRSLHRVAGHVLVALVGLYVLRGYFKRLFLGPRGRTAWRISVGFAFVCLAFLLTGEALPWNQHAYWQTVVNTNLVGDVPVVGGRMANAVRGGDAVSGATLVRVYAIHAIVLPWIAFGLIVLARNARRRGDLA